MLTPEQPEPAFGSPLEAVSWWWCLERAGRIHLIGRPTEKRWQSACNRITAVAVLRRGRDITCKICRQKQGLEPPTSS
jgi:hypothetical protein